MKKFIAILALLVASCIPANPPQVVTTPATDIEAKFDTVGSLVANVGTEDEPRWFSYCSGVFVKDYLLTAAHCVEDHDGTVDAEVQVGTYRDFDGESGVFSRTWTFYPRVVMSREDVAILVPASSSARLAHGSTMVAGRDVEVGDHIQAFGHPRAYMYYYSEGRVVTPKRVLGNDGRPFTLINATIYRGMSGGPVFNEQGYVVGLNSFIWNGKQNLSGITTRESLVHLIEIFNRRGLPIS